MINRAVPLLPEEDGLMPAFKPELRGGTDIAALGGGAVAIAVTLFSGDGPFGIVNAVVSATLFFVFFAYVWRTLRTKMQSIAFAATIGLVLMPASGYLYERYQAKHHHGNNTYFVCSGETYNLEDNKYSRVCQTALGLFWFIIASLTLSVDLLFQYRWHRMLDDTAVRMGEKRMPSGYPYIIKQR